MKLKHLLWLLMLAACWGPTAFFVKVAVKEIPPITLVAGQVGLACALLYLILKAQKRPLPIGMWSKFAIIGLFANALPFILITWAGQYIDSALAAIINGTVPIFTVLLAHFFISDDRLDLTKVSGVGLGFGGLLLLIVPSILGGVKMNTWGLVAVTGASLSYGIAIVYTRKYLCGLPPLTGPAAQLSMAFLYLLPLAVLIEQPWTMAPPSWAALGAFIGLAILATALAYVVYYRLLEMTSASYASMATYLIPIVGMVLGRVVLSEELHWNAYVGCVVVIVGIMIANGTLKLPVKEDQPIVEIAS